MKRAEWLLGVVLRIALWAACWAALFWFAHLTLVVVVSGVRVVFGAPTLDASPLFDWGHVRPRLLAAGLVMVCAGLIVGSTRQTLLWLDKPRAGDQ